jgi:hypothetical protein
MALRQGTYAMPAMVGYEAVGDGYALGDELSRPHLFKVVGGLSGSVDVDAHVILSTGQERTMPAKDLHENNALVTKVFADTALTTDDFYLWR